MRRSRGARGSFVAPALSLIAACVLVALPLVASPINESSNEGRQRTTLTDTNAEERRTRYRINLDLNFDARTYTGTERVRWTNEGDRPTSILYFHLYANFRRSANVTNRPSLQITDDAALPTTAPPPSEGDEPRIEILEVRSTPDTARASAARPMAFGLENEGTVLRVALGESIIPGSSVEIEIRFRGSVPEIETEETGLLAHVVQQVDAVLSDARETRRARDTNFRSRGIMLLGAAYPVLAVRDENGNWQRRVEASVGRLIFTEAADYHVTVNAPADVALFTSGESGSRNENATAMRREFTGERLRAFAVLASRTLRVEERNVGGVRVRSLFTHEHERTGRRVLNVAAEAVRIYTRRFGALPLRTIYLAEAPLVAGLGRAEFPGLGVVASAYYVDFDSPSARSLPQLVREQRASVEDSLEWTVAQLVAHQWWGASVGSDPQRAPVIDGALSSWSALHYFREAHGEERARQTMNDQLRGVYEIYRTFGGEDAAANRAARDYRNSFQYAAIIHGKAALMFERLRGLMQEERFWTALRRYYETNCFEIAEIEDLRASFVAEVPPVERRAVTRTFNRWLTERHGDEDVAPPNPQLIAALGITTSTNETTSGTPRTGSGTNNVRATSGRNSFSRLGRFFWKQMTRIR